MLTLFAVNDDAELPELAERAREAFRLHAEPARNQRLFVGQGDLRGAGSGVSLVDEKLCDALWRGLSLQLLDLVHQLPQPHQRGGEHVERQLRLIEHGPAQSLLRRF